MFSKEKLTLGCQVCFRARNVCLKRLFETFVSKPAEGGGREGPPGGGKQTNSETLDKFVFWAKTNVFWKRLFWGQKLTFSGNVCFMGRN